LDTYDLTFQLIRDPSFVRWVRGSQQDEDHWQKWMKESPTHKVAVEQARSLVLGVSFRKTRVTDEQITNSWDKLSERIQVPIIPNRNASNNYWKYAAIIGLLVCASIVATYFSFNATTTHYKTAFGETLKLQLDDGTRVTLNGNSSLEIEKNWLDKQQREVYLIGEAYFTVSSIHQGAGKVPFLVLTPDLKIKVLGTEFNVNSRRGHTQVVLNEGKVALDIPKTAEATMSPGDLVVYSAKNHKITRRQVNPEIYTSWRKQQLVLDDTPVSHIIRQLEDTYGVRFVLSDNTIRDRKISSTGSISAEDLETVLMAMSTLLQVRLDREENTIYIYEK
jgi:ferric-dicitrate binding protein FerR (iron transport regulator)